MTEPALPNGPTPADIYREIGEETRYHLGWRERLLVGFVVASSALAVAFHSATGLPKIVVAMAGEVFALAIFFLEERSHEILLDRRKVGRRIEEAIGCHGVYSSATDVGKDPKTLSHTTVLRWLYLLGGTGWYCALVWTLVGESRLVDGSSPMEAVVARCVLPAVLAVMLLAPLAFAVYRVLFGRSLIH